MTELMNRVFPQALRRIHLAPQSNVPEDHRRKVCRDHFAVADNDGIHGEHVALLEDTWVQGGHAQSAAAALFHAGAAEVTVIPIARRLVSDFPDTSAFLSRRTRREYDLDLCPVTGSDCPVL